MKRFFTDLFVQRKVLAISLSLIIVILGIQALTKLQVREYPQLTTTVVSISTTFTGADSETMQSFVTSKIEEAVGQVDNVDYMSSSSSAGSSSISVKMNLNTDPNEALANVLAKVNSVRRQLPSEVDDPVVSVSSGDMNAIMFVSFNSKELETPQIKDYLERVVKPQLFTVNGVSKVDVFGASDYALRIWLDKFKLNALNLSTQQVMTALSNNNIQSAAGNSNGFYVTYKNDFNTTYTDVDSLKELIIVNEGSQIVRLKDIAEVTLDKSSDGTRATVNGNNAVVLSIEPSADANMLTVAKNLYPIFDQVREKLPTGMDFSIIYDKTTSVNKSINEIIKTIFEATIIVLIAILLFLGNLRSVIIPLIAIPLSLIGVLFLLQITGLSINLMTLLALILSVGLVVDDAIIVLENVDRLIKNGETPFNAAIKGIREITTPIISTTITLIVVYVPLIFSEGITSTLFKEFAITLAGSVFISAIIALTLSPMLSSVILKPKKEHKNYEGAKNNRSNENNENNEKALTLNEGFSEKINEDLLNNDVNKGGKKKKFANLEERIDHTLTKITKGYLDYLNILFEHKKKVLGFAFVILCSIPFLFSSLPSELTPNEDKGFLMARGSTLENSNIDYQQENALKFEKLIKAQIPEVKFIQTIAGIGGGAFTIMSLDDIDNRERSQTEIQAQVNQIGKEFIPMIFSSFARPEINTGESGMPVSLIIKSTKSFREMSEVVDNIVEKAKASGNFMFVNTDLKFSSGKAKFTIDKQKAGLYNIKMSDISNALSSLVAGGTTTRINLDGRSYSVIAQMERDERLSPEMLKDITLFNSQGKAIPLSLFVDFELVTEPEKLAKFNQLNAITVSGVSNLSIGDATNYMKTLADQELTADYQYEFGGQSRQYLSESNVMLYAFILSMILVFLVLAIQFESWKDPLAIMTSVPLSLVGALVILNLFGISNNIYSQIGLITLISLITKHAILLTEVAKEEQLKNKTKLEAIKIACELRLRPILMTSLCMIAGLIPLLYATGAGANARLSIASTITGGLAIGTVFTLFIFPMIYLFISDNHKPLKRVDF